MFYQDLNTNLDSDNKFSDQGKFAIKELKIGVDVARLFNYEYVQWGVMKLQESSGIREEKDVEFLFIINDIT